MSNGWIVAIAALFGTICAACGFWLRSFLPENSNSIRNARRLAKRDLEREREKAEGRVGAVRVISIGRVNEDIERIESGVSDEVDRGDLGALVRELNASIGPEDDPD